MRKILTMTLALGLLAGAAQLMAQQPEVKTGPEHAVFKECEGSWDANVKSKGGESKGSATYKVYLNGLWLLEHFKADYGGMTFEGRGATSYDATKKKYVGIWIDSMSSTPMISEGTYDKSTKTMTMHGMMPMPDGKSVKVVMTTVHKDADTKTFTIRGASADDKDAEMLQITYKRHAK